MSVPALRFNREDGSVFPEWSEKTIESEVDFLSGFPFDGEDIKEDTAGVRLLRGVNITEGKIRSSLEIDRFYNGDLNKLSKYLLKQYDLVIGMDGSKVGKNSALITKKDSDTLLVQRVARLRAKSNSSIFFLYQNINSNKFHSYVDKVKTSSGIPHISAKQIKEFRIFFPVIEEQTKIANFLTAVDEKITQLTQKNALLTQYKKGVMQKIFSQELRFKDDDGQDFPEWEDKVLSDIGKSFNGLVGKSGDDFGSGKAYITYKQIFDSSKIDVGKFSFVEIGENERQNKVKYGDVFFTTSSETPNEVGFCSVLLTEVDDVYLNSFCFGYRVDSFEKLSPLFLQFLFHSSDFREDVIKLAQGSTRYNISKVNFMEITVRIPCIHEQTKIANFLTAIDDKITAAQTQLQAVKQYKQGLLQQMFV